MNKLFKLTNALLITTLVTTPFSGIISQNDNVAKAEYTKQNKKSTLSQKEENEAHLVSEHVKLVKKNNIYQFKVLNENLKEYLKSINSNLTTKEINDFYNKLNVLLKQEKGQGQITDAILQIKYESKQLNHGFRGCSGWFGAAGLATSTGYGALGLALGASGPAGWALLGASTLVGAGFLAVSELC